MRGVDSALTTTRRSLLLAAAVFLICLGAGLYLDWPAVVEYTWYKSDIRQSPHWAAYHTNSFRADDLLVRYGTFNESPVQNALYWIGTWFVDMVTLTKVYAFTAYGLAGVLYFALGSAMFGIRRGLACALFFAFFPDQWEFFAGAFSSAWAIPLVLVCVYLLEQERFAGFLVLVPFAALAYPVISVLIGGTATAYAAWVLFDRWTRRKDVRQVLRTQVLPVVIANALAILCLLPKYLDPPDFVGRMVGSAALRAMPEMYAGGIYAYLPVPALYQELLRHLGHPFVIFSFVVFVVGLRRQIVWRPAWTALLFASVSGYLLASLLFMHLYIPNRYTQFSIPVLMALWHANNWDALIARLSPQRRRWGWVALIGVALLLSRSTLVQGTESDTRAKIAPLCAWVRTLPNGVLLAGHPGDMDDIPVQARRSALVNRRMAHPWFDRYYAEVVERTDRSFRAVYATRAADVEQLRQAYGVTHLVVRKRLFRPDELELGDVYVEPFNETLRTHLRERRRERFLFAPPRPEWIVYEDERYWVVDLGTFSKPRDRGQE